jgi:hypothetical protein
MRTTIIRVCIALTFAAVAWLSWRESRLTERVADAQLGLATFEYDAMNALEPKRGMSDFLPGDAPHLADEVRVAKANVAYWLGQYDGVAANGGGESDAAILLAAANAAFRASQRDPATGPVAVQRLDGVLQAYAAAMKASSRNSDAAYNYEYVARMRDQVARATQSKTAKVIPPAGVVMGGDLPAGPTIHGSPGGPPPDARTEEFQTIMPMEYGDREAQPEPTPGAKRERKG